MTLTREVGVRSTPVHNSNGKGIQQWCQKSEQLPVRTLSVSEGARDVPRRPVTVRIFQLFLVFPCRDRRVVPCRAGGRWYVNVDDFLGLDGYWLRVCGAASLGSSGENGPGSGPVVWILPACCI